MMMTVMRFRYRLKFWLNSVPIFSLHLLRVLQTCLEVQELRNEKRRMRGLQKEVGTAGISNFIDKVHSSIALMP